MQLPEAHRKTVSELQNLVINPGGAGGQAVLLRQVAQPISAMGPSQITRQDRQRYIAVQGVPQGRSPGEVQADMQKQMEGVHLPRGFYWAWGTDQQRRGEEFAGLGVSILLAIALIYMLLASQFESFIYPLIVLCSVPLSITGVLVALFLTNRSMGLTAMIGMLMLVGIVVKNGILLVDYTNVLRRRGIPREEAVLNGRPHPASPHPHDGLRRHPRHAPPRPRPGQRFRGASAHGHRRHRRPDDLHLPDPLRRPDCVYGLRRHGPMAPPRKGGSMSEQDLTTQAEQLVRMLPRVFRQVFRHDPGDPAHELPAAQLRVCSVLLDGPLPITALARELGTSVSAATQLADRLEAGGMVARVAEPEDRRVRHLMLTQRGDEVMRRRLERRIRRAAEVLAYLRPEQRAEVLATLSGLADAALLLAPENAREEDLPAPF